MAASRIAHLLTASLALPGPLLAGAYSIGDRVALDPASPLHIPVLAIMHPLGWTGAGGVHELKVCAVGDLKSATWRAVFMWNNRTPTLGNCGGAGCFVVGEDPPDPGPPPVPYDAMSAILHELGHCAFGLAHTTMDSELNPSIHLDPKNPGPTAFATYNCDIDDSNTCGNAVDFSPSANAVAILSAPGEPQGSALDEPLNFCSFLPKATVPEHAAGSPEGICDPCCPTCPGPDCPTTPMQIQPYGWFRKSDNNPFVVDATVIDRLTFGRNPPDLPAGHKSARNANRAVGEALVPPVLNTQAVMYASQVPGQFHKGLTADDVNMVKMAETGSDRLANTADDYRTFLRWTEDCTSADILVDVGFTEEDALGTCSTARVLSFPQSPLRFHYSLALPGGEPRLPILLNITQLWDEGPEVVFLSGFETGDSSEWTSVVPP